MVIKYRRASHLFYGSPRGKAFHISRAVSAYRKSAQQRFCLLPRCHFTRAMVHIGFSYHYQFLTNARTFSEEIEASSSRQPKCHILSPIKRVAI